MLTVVLFMGIGLVYSLIAFFICESRSLKMGQFSDKQCSLKEEKGFKDSFKQHYTLKYMLYYFLMVFIFSIFIVNLSYIPNGFWYTEIIPYLSITPLLGALFILFFKWRSEPVLKILSSFLFLSGFILASGSAFVMSYMIHI